MDQIRDSFALEHKSISQQEDEETEEVKELKLMLQLQREEFERQSKLEEEQRRLAEEQKNREIEDKLLEKMEFEKMENWNTADKIAGQYLKDLL